MRYLVILLAIAVVLGCANKTELYVNGTTEEYKYTSTVDEGTRTITGLYIEFRKHPEEGVYVKARLGETASEQEDLPEIRRMVNANADNIATILDILRRMAGLP